MLVAVRYLHAQIFVRRPTDVEKPKILKSGLNNPILIVGAGGLGC